ncbi:MAG TPA: archease [Chloroflexota bacterium]|nr:archease [Chloroflexota bacterium]
MVTVSLIDHTADIGVDVLAPDPAAAFVAAAQGMFDIVVGREAALSAAGGTGLSRSIELRADGWEDLLVAWLEELLFIYETERVVPAAIDMAEISASHLAATMQGHILDPCGPQTGLQIKAVTYHQLRAGPSKRGFEIRVIFDV